MKYTSEVFNIRGIDVKIPFAIIGTKTIIDTSNNVLKKSDINQNIYNLAKQERVSELLQELQSQYLRECRTASGIVVEGHYGPLFISNDIPADCFALHPSGGIILNEVLANGKALDSDGDHAIAVHMEGDYWCIVKYPLTQQIPILRKIDYTTTTFTNLTEDLIDDYQPPTKESLIKIGYKVLQAPPIGTEDNKWDQIEASRMSKIPLTDNHLEKDSGYHKRTSKFLDDYGRFEDIELNGLKTIRKEGSFNNTTTNNTLRLISTSETAWILGFDRGKDALSRIPFEQAVYQMSYLQGCEFQTVPTEDKEPIPELFPTTPSAVDSKKKGTVDRLIERGVLRITEYQHIIPTLRYSVISLFAPAKDTGNLVEVALTTSSKRDASVMNYIYVIPPIIGRDKDTGELVPITIKQAVDLHVADADCFMPNVGQFWPRNRRDINNNPIKASMIESRIRSFVAKYGWPLYFNNKDVQTNAALIASQSIFVHFQSLDPKVKADFLGHLGAMVNKYGYDVVPCGGDKKGNEYTKVAVCDPVTFSPLYCGGVVNPKRACQIKGPLATSVGLKRKALLVVTGPYDPINNKGTSAQMYGTKKGMELSKLSNVFLNRFSTEKDEIHTKRVTYYNFSGEKLEGFIAPPQETSPIPKLITPSGIKNMVMGIDDNITVNYNGEWVEPDYLLSIDEVKAKGSLKYLLDKGLTKTTMRVGDNTFEVAVVELNFYRTTTPSECIKPLWTKRLISGMERHAIAKVYLDFGLKPQSPPPPNKAYIDMLFTAMAKLQQVLYF